MTDARLDLDAAKARQILAGAHDAFVDLGYEGASMDKIARRAGVSKATLYNYFPDKEALFDAAIREATSQHASHVLAVFVPKGDIREEIREVAQRLTTVFCSPSTQALYRLSVAEGQRFPHVARAVYEHGPDSCGRRLGQHLAVACSRGELEIDDIEIAAHHLAALCRALLFERLLFGMQTTATPAEITRIADAAAEAFLRAYAPGRSAQPGRSSGQRAS